MTKIRLLSSAVSFTALLLSGCASTDYGTRDAGNRPDDLSTTEAGFWYQMDKAESQLKTSGSLNEDPILNGMVNDIICKVSGDYCADLRVYIVNEANFNAFMAPNGMSVVFTGMMLRAEDEHQLAAVLAHEFVHFEENHSLETYATNKNASRAVAVLAGAGGLAGAVIAIGVAGEAMSFSREKETEADLKGLKYLGDAGYNTESAVILWQNLKDEYEASEFKKKSKRARKGAGFFDTHPGIQDRIAQLSLMAAEYPPQDTDPHAYRDKIRPFLKSWLDSEVVKRDFGATLQLVERLSTLGTDLGVLQYAKGRIFALRAEDGDADRSKTAYLTATEYDDVPADAFRGLGEIYRKENDGAKAASAFENYLKAAPNARDAALIRKLITNLKGEVE